MERFPIAIDRAALDRHLAQSPGWPLHPPPSHYTAGFGDADFAKAVRIGNDHLIPRSLSLWFTAPPQGARITPEDYLQALLAALERTAGLFDDDREVQHIVLGDGLPEWLGCRGIGRLLAAVPRHLRTVALPDVALRLRPGSPVAPRSLAAVGCTRAILLDDGQAGASPLLALRAGLAGAGFAATGHLLAGTPAPQRLQQALAWQPDRIELAWCRRAAVPAAELLVGALQQLGEAGYRPAGLDTFTRGQDPLWSERGQTPYCDLTGSLRPERTDLVGIGLGAQSQLGDVLCQAVCDPARWGAAIAAGHLGIERGLIQSRDEAQCADIVQSLACAYRLDAHTLQWSGERPFRERFAPALARLQPLLDEGLGQWRGQVLSLSCTGALLWRIFAGCFQHPELAI